MELKIPLGEYPCFVKSRLTPLRFSRRTDCLKRPGSVAYGMARNWTTFATSGVMIPAIGPRIGCLKTYLSVVVGIADMFMNS